MVKAYCLETHFWSKKGEVYTGVAMPTNPAARTELESIVDDCQVADEVPISGKLVGGNVLFCKGVYDLKTREKLSAFVKQYEKAGAYLVTGDYVDLLGWDWLEKALRSS